MLLAQELYEEIVISCDDRNTVLHCARVGRSWVAPSRSRYFVLTQPFLVELTGLNPVTHDCFPEPEILKENLVRTDQLIALLQNPHTTFAEHLSSLELRYPISEPPDNFLTKLNDTSVRLIALVMSETGGAVMGPITNIPPSLPSRLTAHMHHLTLTCASLTCNASISLISPLSCIVELTIDTWSSREAERDVVPSPGPPPPSELRTLTLVGSDYIVESYLKWIARRPSLVTLSSLSIRTRRYESFESLAFITRFSSTKAAAHIQHLSLYPTAYDINHLHLGKFLELRHLELHLSVEEDRDEAFGFDYIDQVIGIIGSLRSPRLEVIDLSVPWSPNSTQCARLDRMIAGHRANGANVKILFNGYNGHPEGRNGLFPLCLREGPDCAIEWYTYAPALSVPRPEITYPVGDQEGPESAYWAEEWFGPTGDGTEWDE